MKKRYIAIDIGCIECGEDSHLIGVFNSEEGAQRACIDVGVKQSEHWHGQHNFEVFEWNGKADVTVIPDYEG